MQRDANHFYITISNIFVVTAVAHLSPQPHTLKPFNIPTFLLSISKTLKQKENDVFELNPR